MSITNNILNIFDNSEKMYKFLEKHNLPKPKHEETDILTYL